MQEIEHYIYLTHSMTTKINGRHINECAWMRNKGDEKSSADTVYCIFKIFEYKS